MRSRAPLAAILLAILAASCGGRPGLAVTVNGETMPTRLLSETQGTPCSAAHGDSFLPPPVPVVVRGPTPLTIRVDAETGFEIRGWIHDVDLPTASGGPVEEFALTSGASYTSRSIVAARTYDVTVNVLRSVLGFRTEVTHGFRMRVEPP